LEYTASGIDRFRHKSDWNFRDEQWRAAEKGNTETTRTDTTGWRDLFTPSLPYITSSSDKFFLCLMAARQWF
jgi:hypothetical protein